MVLKFGVVHQQLSACVKGNCPKRGFYIDAMDAVCQAWRLDCIFDWFNGTDFGDVDQNGVATGLLGAIERGEYDATLPYMTPTYRRFHGFAFSEIYRITDMVLMTRTPTVSYKSTNWNMFYAFSWETWICLLVATGLVAMWSAFVLAQFKRDLSEPRESKVQTSESRSVSIRMITCVWLFVVLILGSAYSGVLFQMQVLSKTDLPFVDLGSFVRCLEERRCRMVAGTVASNAFQRLMTPETDYGQRMARSMVYNPIIIDQSLTKVVKMMLEETDQYITAAFPTEIALSSSNGNKDCRFYMLELGVGELQAFATSKNSSILPLLNRIASTYIEAGLHNAVTRMGNYVGSGLRCDATSQGQVAASNNDDEIASLRSIMIIFGIGILCSFIAFGLEVIVSHRFRNTNYRLD